MLATTISVSGKILTSFLIFKGQPCECIALREFPMYPDAGKYACREKAWMHEMKMLSGLALFEAMEGGL